MGIKHLLLLKKPDAFQLGSDDPDDPKVQKTLGLLGIGDTSKMPKPAQLVLAQLAFANSDLAFQGNHLFHGKLLWRQYLRHLRSGEGQLVDFDGLSGWTGRRVGLQEPDVHVGGNAERPTRLRYTGISAAASAPLARRTREETRLRRQRKKIVSAA